MAHNAAHQTAGRQQKDLELAESFRFGKLLSDRLRGSGTRLQRDAGNASQIAIIFRDQ